MWFTLKNLIFAGLFQLTGYAPDPQYAGTPWNEHGSAAVAGYDADKLAGVGQLAGTFATDAIVVIQDGSLLWEYGDTKQLSYLASVRKSILAMLYGPFVGDGNGSGAIDLERTLADLGIDDVGGLLPIERGAKVRDLISARSGIYHVASNPGDNLDAAPPRGSQKPGSYYLYSNWDFNAAGTVFEKATGLGIYEAFGIVLAEPLGFEHWTPLIQLRTGDTDRSEHKAYHFILSTRDMARLGELMRMEGNWQGEQVIPAAWARRIVSVVTPNQEMNPQSVRDTAFGYGYMWWVWDGPKVSCAFEGAYTARGAYGQYITVLPLLGMVVAHKTLSDDETLWHEYAEILSAIIASRSSPVC